MEFTDGQAGTPQAKSEALPPAKRFAGDVVLRVLLFAATLAALTVTLTDKQTKSVQIPGAPVGFTIRFTAKFKQFTALKYLAVALSIACLYSIVTTAASISVILKPVFSSSNTVLLGFVFTDMVMLGLLASATGGAGVLGHIGLNGESHLSCVKLCSTFDKFCDRLIGSFALSILSSILLILLSVRSTFSLYKQLPA